MIVVVAFLVFAIVLSSCLTFLLLRHWMLTAITIVAPLLAYFAVFGADLLGSTFTLAPDLVLSGWVVAIAMADEFVIAQAGGEGRSSSMRFANLRIIPAVVALGVCLFFPILGGVSQWVLSLRVSLPLAFVLAFTAAAMQLALVFAYGEDTISAVNRFRERAERKTDFLLRIAQNRWAFATSGIALVFATLVIFRQDPSSLESLMERSHLWVWPLALPFGAAWLVVLARDWRVTLAATFVLIFSMLFDLPYFAPLWVPTIFIALVTFQIAIYARRGDEMDMAVAQMFTRSGLGFTISAILAVLFEMGIQGVAWVGNYNISTLHIVVASAAGILSALVFLPAFAVAIETLFPRRETLEARYRVH